MVNTYNTSSITEIDSRLDLLEAAFEFITRQFFPNGNYQHFIMTGDFEGSVPQNENLSPILNIVPTRVLNKLNSDTHTKFKNEIRQKRTDGNKMYFDLVDEVFAKHFQFIIKYFQPILENHFKKEDKFIGNITYQFVHKNAQAVYASNSEFLKAVRNQYLSIFESLEIIVSESYPDYKRLLTTSLSIEEKIEDYFRTNYSREKLLEVHKGLNQTYIDCPSEQFMRMFEPSSAEIKKTQWLNTEKTLVLLFMGDLSNGLQKLRVSNTNFLSLIEKYFCNKKGKPFKASQLGIVNQSYRAKPIKDSKAIFEIIATLNS
jgi:hemerythrin